MKFVTAHLYEHKISYFSVPKCACSSLKSFFFELQNGFAFKNFKINNDWFHVHRFYLSRPFKVTMSAAPSDHFKYVALRDPVSRMVSCYRNRVDNAVGRNLMKEKAAEIQNLGLPLHPTWQEFLDHLPAYQSQVPMLKHHSEPLSHFLGRDPSYFDMIVNLKELPKMIESIGARVGTIPVLGREQTEGVNFTVSMVTEAEKKKIHDLFAEDIEIFGKYF